MNLLASLAIAAGVLATLTWLALMLAGMPNSKPEQLAQIRRWMLLAGLAGLACAVGGAWLVKSTRPGYGALVGGFPVLSLVVGIVWISVR